MTKRLRLKNRIRHYRLEHGLGQREFARALGVAQNTLRQWENGKCNPNESNLQKIADVLQVEPKDLIYFEI